MTTKTKTWASFRRLTLKDYEPPDRKRSGLQSFVVGDKRKRAHKRLVLFTKQYLLQTWKGRTRGALPTDVLAFVSYGLPTAMYMKWVQHFAEHGELGVSFVGDLDPLDLSVYLALRCGDADLRKPKKVVVPIAYKGIDDAWLALCERSFKSEFTLKSVSIKMEPVECEHWAIIEKLLGAQEFEELIGPGCLALLKSGLKLELEGASNPSFYKRGFPKRLREHLLGQ